MKETSSNLSSTYWNLEQLFQRHWIFDICDVSQFKFEYNQASKNYQWFDTSAIIIVTGQILWPDRNVCYWILKAHGYRVNHEYRFSYIKKPSSSNQLTYCVYLPHVDDWCALSSVRYHFVIPQLKMSAYLAGSIMNGPLNYNIQFCLGFNKWCNCYTTDQLNTHWRPILGRYKDDGAYPWTQTTIQERCLINNVLLVDRWYHWWRETLARRKYSGHFAVFTNNNIILD